ncbi:APC family permease [Fusibacter sp. JL216-2]|uniref:APC family permease n=1 Tax=Fusibacter sp. JL216-2 TaxID=3071453 RepID=UPI003D331395
METASKVAVKAEKKLAKSMGLADAMVMVVGMVIGSGIFFKTSTVLNHAGNPFLSIMAWLAGGCIAMASALTISEIATAIPETGGVFAYLRTLYSEKMAFLYGWVQSLIYVPGSIAALSVVFVTQATFFIPMNDMSQRLLAMGTILFLVVVNIISTKLGSKVQIFATVGKLIPIGIIIFFGLSSGSAGGVKAVTTVASSATGLAGFGAAMLGTLWAYDGWIGVTNIAGELKNPGKDLPKAIIFGLSAIIIVYVLFNTALINVVPAESLMGSEKPATDVSVALFGDAGAALIAGGIMVSIFGALNGYLMTGVRIPFAMGQRGLFPYSEKIGRLSDKGATPVNALVLEGLLACLYVLSGSFEILTNLAMFVVWIFFIITVAGIFKLRKSFGHLKRTYHVPLYPFMPIVGIAGGLYIVISTIFNDAYTAGFGIAITLTGLPVYAMIKKKAK